MPRGLSSTILPAGKVRDACTAALVALETEREALKDTVVAGYKASSFSTRFKSRDKLLLELPGHMKAIFEEYRTHDRDVLKALCALCKAAYAHNKDFTVEVTADDFRLLEAFY